MNVKLFAPSPTIPVIVITNQSCAYVYSRTVGIALATPIRIATENIAFAPSQHVSIAVVPASSNDFLPKTMIMMNVPNPNSITNSPKYHQPGPHVPLKMNANGPVQSITHSGPP